MKIKMFTKNYFDLQQQQQQQRQLIRHLRQYQHPSQQEYHHYMAQGVEEWTK